MKFCFMIFSLFLFGIASLALGQTSPDKAEKEKAAQDLFVASNWPKAEAAYADLLKLNDKSPLYLTRLGTARIMQQKWEACLEPYKKAIVAGGPAGFINYNMACAYARLGRKDEALDCLEIAVNSQGISASGLLAEKNLASLRSEARFKAFVDKLENPTRGMKGADALDHWIGDWDVYNLQGLLVGKSHIVRVLNGYGVEEHWESRFGTKGQSFYAFDAATGKWKQLWIGDTGGVADKEGGSIENGIQLIGLVQGQDGKMQKGRETVTKNPDGSVHQVAELWDDSKNDWVVTIDLKYVRKKAN